MDYSDIVSFTWYAVIQGTECNGWWNVHAFMLFRAKDDGFKPVLVAHWRNGRKVACSEDDLKVIEDYFLENPEWWGLCEQLTVWCKTEHWSFHSHITSGYCRPAPYDEKWNVQKCENC